MEKMVFFNITWMERYEGFEENLKGGGAFVDECGYGYEIFNFKKINGKVYGFVQCGGLNNLQRLGAAKNDDRVDDILAVFTAAHRNGNTYIVGWYKHATFFKDYHDTNLKERYFEGEYLSYNVVAKAKDAVLLPPNVRCAFPKIPRGIKGGMGRSNVWYADSEEAQEFKEKVYKFIKEYEKIMSNPINLNSLRI